MSNTLVDNDVISVEDRLLRGQPVTITVKQRRRRYDEKRARSRAYVWYPTETFCGTNPPYTMKGEDPANDKAWRDYNKQELRAMQDILVLAGFDTDEWRYSRKAGCSCNCSPGFVRKNDNDFNYEFFITVTLCD